ncbi:hypothetical protein BDC45DRAFT_530382 [Circinella umbellata]|nr:hypothetical protein BDC45DRAFT_530382 [Circinella umbellata]
MSAIISKYKGKVFETFESSLPRRSIFVDKPIEEWSLKNYVKHHPQAELAIILANMKRDLYLLALRDLPTDVKRYVRTLKKESEEASINDVKEWLQPNSSSSSTHVTFSGPVQDVFTGDNHHIVKTYKASSKRVASSKKPRDQSINNDNNDNRGVGSSSDDDSLFNNQEGQRENINETEEDGGFVVGSKTRDIFDIDNDTLTTTTPQQLDVTEIIPSTSSSSSSSITRSALFQWAHTLYLKKSVTMSTTILGIIREQRVVSISDALTKMAANLLKDWTTSDVDDTYRFTLSLSLSLIVDVSNNNTSKKMLKALGRSHVDEVKEHSKSQSSTIKELPASILLIFKETIELLELEGDHQALRHLYNVASKQLETEKDNITLQIIDIITYVIRNAKKWGNEKGETEVDWTHRLVSLLDIW